MTFNTTVDNMYLKQLEKAATVVYSMAHGAQLKGYEYTTENSKMSYELRLIEAEDALIDAINQRRHMRRTMRDPV